MKVKPKPIEQENTSSIISKIKIEDETYILPKSVCVNNVSDKTDTEIAFEALVKAFCQKEE